MKKVIVSFGYSYKMTVPLSAMTALTKVLELGATVDSKYKFSCSYDQYVDPTKEDISFKISDDEGIFPSTMSDNDVYDLLLSQGRISQEEQDKMRQAYIEKQRQKEEQEQDQSDEEMVNDIQ